MNRIEMRGIEKSFGAVNVLCGVDFHVAPGEVVGLVGDNGAGKSTLMKVLSGVLKPDAGVILVDGARVTIDGPRDARNHGIEMVYQDLALCDDLDVASNLFLGREQYGRWTRRLNHRAMHLDARKHLNDLNIKVSSTGQEVASLSGGQRQAVAVARAATFGPRILVLDEPTAALSAREVALVLQLVRDISAQGVSVVLITHRFQDLFDVAARLLVLRAGRITADLDPQAVSMEELVSEMMGGRT